MSSAAVGREAAVGVEPRLRHPSRGDVVEKLVRHARIRAGEMLPYRSECRRV